MALPNQMYGMPEEEEKDPVTGLPLTGPTIDQSTQSIRMPSVFPQTEATETGGGTSAKVPDASAAPSKPPQGTVREEVMGGIAEYFNRPKQDSVETTRVVPSKEGKKAEDVLKQAIEERSEAEKRVIEQKADLDDRKAAMAEKQAEMEDDTRRYYEIEGNLVRDAHEAKRKDIVASEIAADKAVTEAKMKVEDTPNSVRIASALLATLSNVFMIKGGGEPNNKLIDELLDRYQAPKKAELAKEIAKRDGVKGIREKADAEHKRQQDLIDADKVRALERVKGKFGVLQKALEREGVNVDVPSLIAAVDAKKAELLDGLGQRGAAKVTSTDYTQPAGTGQSQGSPNQVFIGGVSFDLGQKRPEQAKKLQEKVAASDTIKSGIRRLRDLMKEASGPATIGPRRAQIEAEATNILLEMKDAKTMGALDKGVQEVGGKLIGDPLSVNQWLFGGQTEGYLKRLDSLEEQIDDGVANYMASVGFDRKAVLKAQGREDAETKETKPPKRDPEELKAFSPDQLQRLLNSNKLSTEDRRMVLQEIRRRKVGERPMDKR